MIKNNFSLVIATFILLGVVVGFMSHTIHKREQIRLAELAVQAEIAAAKHAEQYAVQMKKHAEQIKCMALNIYHEAGSEPFMGQVAVARVVMNRVRHGFASSPCKVIYQAHYVPHPEDPATTRKLCQFSWVCEGKEHPGKHNVRYKQAEEIARQVILEDRWREDIPGSVLFFHNTTVDPNWAYRRIMTIGNHIFYGRPVKKKAEVAQNS